MRTRAFYKKGFWRAGLVAAGVLLCFFGRAPGGAAAEDPASVADRPAVALPDAEAQRQTALAEAKQRRQDFKQIYERERNRLREDLKSQLAQIERSGNDREARRAAMQAWKADDQNLKAAYQAACAQCDETIAELGGRPARRRSAGAIEILRGPARKTCPINVKINKGGCRRCPRAR